MSTYEDYADASGHYDTSRVPVGVEILLGAMATGRAPLEETHVLDAGCGTGSFSVALAPHVGALTLLDANPEMLAVAEAKLGSTPGVPPFETVEGHLQELPFDDACFDAVMTNQVLHHLGDPDGEAWPQHGRVFAEYARVLRPGGVLSVNTTSEEQIRHGWWAFSLIPDAVEEMVHRYAPLELIEQLMEVNGLTLAGRFVPVTATIQGDSYFDPDAPLSEAWRRGDSTWSLATDAEIEAAEETLTDLRARGALKDYVAEHDARRPAIGQVTFLIAHRD